MINLQTRHIVLLVVAGVIAGLVAVQPQLIPGSQAYLIVIGALGFLTVVKAVFTDAPSTAASTPKPPVLPVLFFVLSALALTLAPACGFFKSSAGVATVNGFGQLAACVIQHVETDPDPTFEGIAAECSGVAIADVQTIVTALAAPVDAGPPAPAARALLVHHTVRQ